MRRLLLKCEYLNDKIEIQSEIYELDGAKFVCFFSRPACTSQILKFVGEEKSQMSGIFHSIGLAMAIFALILVLSKAEILYQLTFLNAAQDSNIAAQTEQPILSIRKR